jgi:hypothetical protein
MFLQHGTHGVTRSPCSGSADSQFFYTSYVPFFISALVHLIVPFACNSTNQCNNSARNLFFLVCHSNSSCNIVIFSFTLFISLDHFVYPIFVEGILWNNKQRYAWSIPLSTYQIHIYSPWGLQFGLQLIMWSSYWGAELIQSALVYKQWFFLSTLISEKNLPIAPQLCLDC